MVDPLALRSHPRARPAIEPARCGGSPQARVQAHWFWGDERFVPHDHSDSNYRMAHEALFSRDRGPSAAGFGLIEGNGLELVLTLGTGVGTALFRDGELAHHPIRNGQTYDEYIGNAALHRKGVKNGAGVCTRRSPACARWSTTTSSISAAAMRRGSSTHRGMCALAPTRRVSPVAYGFGRPGIRRLRSSTSGVF